MTFGVILVCLLATSSGDLLTNGSSNGLTASPANQSLNTQFMSKCSLETVQRLKFDQT